MGARRMGHRVFSWRAVAGAGLSMGCLLYSSLSAQAAGPPRPAGTIAADVTQQANSPQSASVTLADQEQTLVDIFDLLVNEHVGPLNPDTLFTAAVNAMIGAAQDPYTEYFSPSEFAAFQNSVNLSYAGIGITLSSADGHVIVDSVMDGKPASAAGVQAKDEIYSMNGSVVSGESLSQITSQILGQAGTTVTIVVKRSGVLLPAFHITRENIQLDPVTFSLESDGIGYIRVLAFSDQTGAAFSSALKTLQTEGARGLIVDLRGNPGGLVDQALSVANDFAAQGTLLNVADAHGQVTSYAANPGGSTLPLAFLVDENTASAAEILSGSLQALHRAVLVGTRTFGKGVMQEPISLPDGGVLKLTVASYSFANGSSPQHVGLSADVPISTGDLQYIAALRQLDPSLKESVAFTLGQPSAVVNGHSVSSPEPLLEAGREYVPLRFVAEAFGLPVRWDASSQTASWSAANHTFTVAENSKTVDMEGAAVQGPSVFWKDGTAYMQVTSIPELLGLQYSRSGSTILVSLK